MLYNEFAAAIVRVPKAVEWIDKLAIHHAITRADALSVAYQAAEAVYMCPWFDGVIEQYSPGRQAELTGDGCAGRHFILIREILECDSGMGLFRYKFNQALHLRLHSEAERLIAKANTYRSIGDPVLEIVASAC